MKILRVGLVFVMSVLTIELIALVKPAEAASPSIIIQTIQAADSLSAKNELIEIYNPTDQPIDVTDWQLLYDSATGGTHTPLVKIASLSTRDHVFLPARSSETFFSSDLAGASPPPEMITFAGGINHLAGHVRLADASGSTIDKVGWGVTATQAEGSPAPVLSTMTRLQRATLAGSTDFQDTDNNAADFQLVPQDDTTFPFGTLFEVTDTCTNIVGIQFDLPPGMTTDVAGNCAVADMCLNLPDVQTEIPDGFEQNENGSCTLINVQPIKITELLPNPDGVDTGHEFIELYNPADNAVDLTFYALTVDQKIYSFLPGTVIADHAYIHVDDNQLGFTLGNLSDQVQLSTIDGQLVDQAETYVDPPAGMSWAVFGDGWHYTDNLTPGAINLPNTATGAVGEAGPQPCAANQYRSPETNRCRLIVNATSSLTPCKDNQYRSEETNRCRTIAVAASATLKPCADDQFRNVATGRCKKIASEDEVTLADCGEGRERNPETNRCRNVASTSVPEAAFAVEPVKETGTAFIGWWALGGVGLVALGYAGWEWRQEVAVGIQKIGRFFSSHK